MLLCLSLLWLGSGFFSTEPRDWLGRTCPCGAWFSCSHFYSVRGLVWSDLVVDLIHVHFLRQCDDFICACSSGFFLRKNHNCTEFLALPFSPFSFVLPFPLPFPPLLSLYLLSLPSLLAFSFLSLFSPSWWRSTVVERRSLTGELSLSCARPAADG